MDRDQGGTLNALAVDALTLRPLGGSAGEMAALQGVLEAAPAYFRLVGGAPAGKAEAQGVFTGLPAGKRYDDKFVFGLYADTAMIGCADVIRGYPTPDKAVIGLLLLAEPWQRRGLGRAFATLVEQVIAGWSAITRLRIGVALANTDALAFWRRLGYRETGEVKPADPTGVIVAVLEKPVPRVDAHG